MSHSSTETQSLLSSSSCLRLLGLSEEDDDEARLLLSLGYCRVSFGFSSLISRFSFLLAFSFFLTDALEPESESESEPESSEPELEEPLDFESESSESLSEPEDELL